MNFFRLRVINTALFFLIGILVGFILKERFYPAHPAQYQQRYQPAYQAQSEAAAVPAPQIETSVEESGDEKPLPDEEEAPAAPAPKPAAKPAARQARTEDDSYAAPIVIEAEPSGQEPDAGGKAQVLRNSAAEFFRRPSDYAGRELEMELQMITAKKTTGGWRLNFAYSGSGKNADYLYVDDDGIVGEKPDLRIGYIYRVRFRCGKGDSASGNLLTRITPTGDKAAWATGLSAVE
jgi:hypothetical protein